MAKPKTTKDTEEISVLEVLQGSMTFGILGTTPLIMNRVNEKAKRQLLLPSKRKTDADRAQSLKHVPMEEYRASVYRHREDKAPTRLKFPSPAFHNAMGTAALDLPGMKKTEVGRLTWVPGTHVDIFGVPQIFMCVVKTADMAKTPDIRTRAIIPEWACIVTIEFVQPKLTKTAVGHLLAASGLFVGIGDNRQGKGNGSNGKYRIVDQDNADLRRILKTGGRAAQDAALTAPECFDEDTDELLSWFSAEVIKLHGKKEAA